MKTVFITGAAAGIGLATAQKYAQMGWLVGLYDINIEAIEKLLTANEFKNAHGGVCDVTCRESIAAALKDFSRKTNQRLDVVVNNAGVLTGGEFHTIEARDNNLMIDINIKGLTDVAQLAFPLLRQTKNSCLVNICSASSIYGTPGLAVYSATKFYVRGLTEALNIEWKKYGIHVTSIKPPFVQTNMLSKVPSDMTKKMSSLQPQYIADAVYSAAEGKSISTIPGLQLKLFQLMTKLLPETIVRIIIQKII
jgi:NADP-dependent 3-hydroxy acid dehydrogenase YdfG